jgi:hypothetical protein
MTTAVSTIDARIEEIDNRTDEIYTILDRKVSDRTAENLRAELDRLGNEYADLVRARRNEQAMHAAADERLTGTPTATVAGWWSIVDSLDCGRKQMRAGVDTGLYNYMAIYRIDGEGTVRYVVVDEGRCQQVFAYANTIDGATVKLVESYGALKMAVAA